jgi:hypothetical protein
LSEIESVIDAVNAGDTELAIRYCLCETQSSEEGLIESLKQTMREKVEEATQKKERTE